MASILIIYGTTSGNTEMVCEKVSEVLKTKKHNVTLKRVERCEPQEMLACDLCILASPTYGHGILQENFAPFQKALKEFKLNGHPCAVIGLGDPLYDAQYHIESAAILEKTVQDCGGTLLIPALKISRSPVLHLQTRVEGWANDLIQALK